jgi:hypothetical protein
MNYESKDISTDELIEADYNPRQISAHDYDNLKESISKFGFAEPILINGHADRENIVIGGHQRLRVAKELGITPVPCFVVNLEAKEERELNIRLNRNHGEFDFDQLANHFDAGDLIDFGFTARELDIDLSIPDDGEFEERPKEKKLDYKLEFNNASELDTFYEFIAELKLTTSDEDFPTLSQKLINYIDKHPIQT